MLKQAVVCNNCGTERKDANHWFVLAEYRKVLRSLMPEETGPNVLGIAVFSLDETTAQIEGAEHICGESCLQRRISACLTKLMLVEIVNAETK
jgi:hypothetical protein